MAFYRARTHARCLQTQTEQEQQVPGGGEVPEPRRGYPTPASFHLSLCTIGSVRAQPVACLV